MDFLGRLENATHAVVDLRPEIDGSGRDVLLVVAKLAFEVDARGAVKLTFAPVRWTAVGDGAGGWRRPDDGGRRKPGTDVGLVGTARPPAGASTEMLAWLSAGPLRKVVRVVAPRTYRIDRGRLEAAPTGPLGPTPLELARAYGGEEPDAGDDPAAREPHNPIGCGFSRVPAKLHGRPAPTLEPPDPGAASVAARAQAVFAPIPRTFEPRRAHLGTFDAEWSRSRSPLPPRDFDARHDHWAAAGLHAPEPLPADVAFEIGGATPEGVWRFSLPPYAPTFEAVVAGRVEPQPTHLDGIFIDADERTVELTYRALFPLPAKWERVERVRVGAVGHLPDRVIYGADPSPPPRGTEPRHIP